MCGIAGMFAKRGEAEVGSILEAMKALHHRGPDGQNHWVSKDKRVCLGHTRLSIIDLATGTQPITNEDGTITVVVNGEFYDFERIRNELIAKGHRFRTGSDSEIVLHLYEEYGTDCMRDLRGEFAFILWDDRNKVLFSARDRLGMKPLFYAEVGEKIYFASEAKALFAAGVPAGWDMDQVFHQMNMSQVSQGRSLFAGVSQMPPGHYMIVSDKHKGLYQYWDFDYPAAQEVRKNKMSETECIEEFKRLFNEAVKLRLRADVPVGCYLSGGLDSSAVMGTASLLGQRIKAFSIGFDHSDYDELAIAEETAKRHNADFHPVPIKQSELADNFADAIWHSETISYGANGVAKFLLSDAVRKAGYKVVLTGEGSDEILAGYPHFRRDQLLEDAQAGKKVQDKIDDLRDENAASVGRQLPDIAEEKLDEVVDTKTVTRRLGFTPTWMKTSRVNGIRYRSLFSAEYENYIGLKDPHDAFLNGLDVNRQLRGREFVTQSMYLWSKCILPNHILATLGDRMEMAHSIEGRLPLMDHHLINFVRNVPVSLKIKDGWEKHILREAVRPVLTDTIYGRKKHPFMAPPSALRKGDKFFEFIRDTLRGKSFSSMPFFDQAKVAKYMDSIADMDANARAAHDVVLTGLLCFATLHSKFKL